MLAMLSYISYTIKKKVPLCPFCLYLLYNEKISGGTLALNTCPLPAPCLPLARLSLNMRGNRG